VGTDQKQGLDVRLAVASVATVGSLVPFALIAVLIVGDVGWLHRLDGDVTDALHHFADGHPGWVLGMRVWSQVFGPNSWRAGALILVIWLVHRRRSWPLAIWVVVTMAAGGILCAVLKLLVGRHRPDLLEPVARASGYSFPSGHALNSALGAAVFVLVLLPLVRDHPRRRVALWTGAVVIPLVTAICRVGLGVHWTSDVVGGLLLGVAVVAATAAAYQMRRRRPAHLSTEGLEPDLAHIDEQA
jgi:membrane-associated phospholipid phosphatase